MLKFMSTHTLLGISEPWNKKQETRQFGSVGSFIPETQTR
jgi:hypothetical protein